MKDLHKQVVSGLEAAVVLTDPAGKVVFSNVPAIRLLGRDLSGVSLAGGTYDDDLPVVEAVARFYRQAAGRSQVTRELIIVEGEDDPRHYWAACTPAGSGGGKAQGDRLIMMMEIGDALGSSATVRKLFSQINHDLRSPLTSIGGAVELLLSGRAGELHDTQQRLVTIVQESAHKMTTILARTKARLAGAQAGAGKEKG